MEAKTRPELIEGEERLTLVEVWHVGSKGASLPDNSEEDKKMLLMQITKVCSERDFTHYRIVTAREIAENEKLKKDWEALGGSEQPSKKVNGVTIGRVSRRLVRFAREESEGFKKCAAR